MQRVSVAINGQPAGELTAPSWTFTSNKPGDYTFEATDAKGRSYPRGAAERPRGGVPAAARR